MSSKDKLPSNRQKPQAEPGSMVGDLPGPVGVMAVKWTPKLPDSPNVEVPLVPGEVLVLSMLQKHLHSSVYVDDPSNSMTLLGLHKSTLSSYLRAQKSKMVF